MTVLHSPVPAMIRTFVLIIAFFVAPISWAAAQVAGPIEQELTLGVLAYRGLDEATIRWQPLADYLSEQVPGVHVHVRPLLRHEAEKVLDRGELQLLLVNPYDYAWLEASRGVTRIATLRPRNAGNAPPMFGAVVFQRADSPPLISLESLQDKRMAAAGADSFPFLMIQRELSELGHDPANFFKTMEHTGLPQSRVVDRVLSGQADAGIVRTGVLEELVAQGRLAPGAVRVLPATPNVAFRQAVSSRLYPEWPFSIAPSLDPAVARHILRALLDLESDSAVSIAADIDGWAPPMDYSGVTALMHELHLGPFAVPPDLALMSLLKRYWSWLFVILAAVLLMVVLIFLRSNRRLMLLTDRLDGTLEGLGDAVFRVDAKGQVSYMNPEAEALCGHLLRDVQGQSICEIMQLVDADTQRPLDGQLERISKGEDVAPLPQRVEVKNHARRVLSLKMNVLRDERGQTQGLVLALHDVTAITRLNEKLRWQAEHDPLTGLFNQRGLERALEEIGQEPLPPSSLYFALLDLDDFKAVNDQAGHAVGDEILHMVADVLLLWSRPGSLVARMSSDEFSILLRDLSLDEVMKELHTLVDQVGALRLHRNGKDYQVGASVGLVEFDRRMGGLEYHLGEADAACVQAKQQGGDRVHLHSPDDADIARHHADLAWVTRLREALHNDDFQLFGQLILPAAPGEEVHCEVLLRLEDGKGMAMPGDFIPAAERQRLMPRIDRRVVKRALELFAPMQDCAVLTINLSAQSVQDPLLGADLLSWFETFGVRPERVCFEITETAALDNLPLAIGLMKRLQTLGCRFALDDFGSGLLSFSMLRSLPVDYLKIDGKLIKEFRQDAVAEVMLGSILDLARLLNMHSIAEWVEDGVTRDILTDLGVNYLQGYGLHRPVPLADAFDDAGRFMTLPLPG